MSRSVSVAVLAAAATLAAATAFADSGMRPGLWEMRISKNIVDGHDTAARMAELNAKMNERMARLSPEQRAQMSAMMGRGGMGMPGTSGGGIRMCITPEMARREAPPVDKDGSCQPTNMHRSGNTVSYELNCVSHGSKITGKGEMTLSGESMTTRSDATVVEHGETHHLQTESEMRFVQGDCGDVKPIHGR